MICSLKSSVWHELGGPTATAHYACRSLRIVGRGDQVLEKLELLEVELLRRLD